MNQMSRIVEYEERPVRFTVDDFMKLAQHPPIKDWVGKIELVEGEIVRMSPANLPHWNAQRLLTIELQAAFQTAGPEWVVGSEAPVRLGTRTLRVPDIGVLRAPDLRATVFSREALFLAVEIADTSLRNDLGRKLRAYASVGVRHYWVVDLQGRKVHVMSDPLNDDYENKRVLEWNEPIAVPGTDRDLTLSLP